MAVKSSLADLDAQIEKLRERKKLLIVKFAERFARAATKSGLAEMEISDKELEAVFEEIAARFRKENNGAARGTAQAHRTADSWPGAQAELSHDL